MIAAISPIIAAIIVSFVGVLLTKLYESSKHDKDVELLKKRHELDKETEWRAHAIELTKLDLQRKLANTAALKPPRPSILDFLANYRDLIDLDNSTPKELYRVIKTSRIETKEASKRTFVTSKEIEKIIDDKSHICRLRKGNINGKELFAGYGRIGTEKYMIVFFYRKTIDKTKVAIPILVREMSDLEKIYYRKAIDPLPRSFLSIEEGVKFWNEHNTTEFADEFEPIGAENKLPK